MRSTTNSKLSIPMGLQVLLRDLDFLSQISRGQKVCINNRVIVDGSSWSGAFYRTRKGEDRVRTINKIEQIVNQTVDAIDNHKDTDYIDILINYFADARNGIAALSFTYQDDPDMKSRINVQLKNIDLQLEQYRHLIKGYADSSRPVKADIRSDNNPIILSEIPEGEKGLKHKLLERFQNSDDRDRLERIERRRRRKNRVSEETIE